MQPLGHIELLLVVCIHARVDKALLHAISTLVYTCQKLLKLSRLRREIRSGQLARPSR